jgi:cytochrome P450
MAEATSIRAPKPYSAIPKVPLLQLLPRLIGNGGGRIDMRGGLQAEYLKYGPVARQGRGPIRALNLFGPDANRFVLMDTDQIFSARKPWMMIMGSIFPNGLLLFDGEQHKHHRKIMHGTFRRPVLREYAQRMSPMIADGIASWPLSDERFLAFPAFKILTLDLATSIFLGVDLGSTTRRMNRAFEDMVAASMSRIRLPIPGLEFHRGLKGREFMLKYLGEMIEKRRANEGGDMFSRLCRAETETGESFADQEILDHMVFLMMAAHDTTTSTLSSMTYELARNPEWQERLRHESRSLGSERPGFDDLDQLTGLTWAMQETLRLYPPLPVIPRISTKPFAFAGYRIPANSMVVVSPIHTHYMDEWWSHPTRFDPERFSPGRAEHQRHTHCWIPFGGGPHMCLGRRFAETQVRLIMHQMLLRFRWSVPDGYRMPVQQAPISKPMDDLPVRLSPLS